MKIGITERGDASIDFSWVNKIKDVDGAIIISKGFNDKFKNELILNQDKIIYHATITGLGGTILEPNVPNYLEMYNNISKLISDGFNVKHIVIRIDPLIGTYLFSQINDFPFDTSEYDDLFPQHKYFAIIEDIIEKFVSLGVRRFRYSYLDLYNHVIKRFENIGFKCPVDAMNIGFDSNIQTEDDISYFQSMIWGIANDVSFEDSNGFPNHGLNNYLAFNEPTIYFESCAESLVDDSHMVGCISKRDLDILGIDGSLAGSSNQRKHCLCPSCKTELLEFKSCNHGCVYCYWK